MSAHQDLTQAWDEWKTATLFKTWARSNPGEAAKLEIYRAGGPKPVLVTATGRALVAETSAWLDTAPQTGITADAFSSTVG